MADFLKINNDEMVRISSVSAISAMSHMQQLTFRADGKEVTFRIPGLLAIVELGFQILDEAETHVNRVATVEDIVNQIRTTVEH